MTTATPTLAEASRLLAARTVSPVELARDCLDRIARLDGALHAFLLTTPERAMDEARAAEARMMRGDALGPLDGVPIAHKDIFDTAGVATTANSRALQRHVPDRDATVVARLAAAGTVMLGKLATHEFAIGGPAFELPWPPPRNPWDTACYAGGSSSGTAIAVAAGMVLGGTGSDTGGSIRGPSILCGVTGIKPTYGRVSRTGVHPLSFSLDHTGPMAWTAEDCALLLQAMAGHDPLDPASVDRPVPDFRAGLGQDLRGLRIGVVRHFHERDVETSPVTTSALEVALQTLQALGATLQDVALSSLHDYAACGWAIQLVEGFAVHEPWLRLAAPPYGASLIEKLTLGGLLRGADYVQALRLRRVLCAEMDEAMRGLDLMVIAGQPGEAAPLAEAPRWPMLEAPGFMLPFNVTGLPAIAVCTGFGPRGLPVGMQIAAKAFDEPMLFRAAHAYERATGWRSRRPGPSGRKPPCP